MKTAFFTTELLFIFLFFQHPEIKNPSPMYPNEGFVWKVKFIRL